MACATHRASSSSYEWCGPPICRAASLLPKYLFVYVFYVCVLSCCDEPTKYITKNTHTPYLRRVFLGIYTYNCFASRASVACVAHHRHTYSKTTVGRTEGRLAERLSYSRIPCCLWGLVAVVVWCKEAACGETEILRGARHVFVFCLYV